VGFFGTTIGFQTSHGSTSTGRGRGRRGASPSPLVDTYNFAMVRRGGANGEQFMHFKHYISSIDFLDATPGWEGTVTYPIMNVSLPPSSQPQPMGHTTKRYPILDRTRAHGPGSARGPERRRPLRDRQRLLLPRYLPRPRDGRVR